MNQLATLKRLADPDDRQTSDYPGAHLPTWFVASLARELISETFGVEPWRLKAWRGDRQLAVYRQIAVHLVHIVAGRTHQEAAASFDRNRSTASHHFETVEDLRDVEGYDAFITNLEQRFGLYLQYAALPSAKLAFRDAIASLGLAVDRGDLEGRAIDAAEYLVATFRDKAA